MSNKEIKIRWLSDDSEIDKSIQRLQQKLTQMNRSSAQVQNIQETGGTLSKRAEYAQKQFQQTSASLLQRESRELEQKQRMENLGLLQKQRELRKVEQSEGAITAEKQKQINLLKEEINLKAQKVMDIEVTRQNIDKNLKEIQGGGPSAAGGGGIPAAPNNQKAMQMFKDLLKGIGVASVINGALNFTQHRLERDRRVLADQGQTASMASRELREQIRGEGTRGLFFASERQKAMQMAAQEQKGMGALDYAKIAGGVATGAAAGSFIPGLGTGIGALVGGIGAFGGMMGGSSRLYNRMFDQDAYKQMLTKEGMEKYETNRKMLELQNPMKSIAFDAMQRNAGTFSNIERAVGLTGRELIGTEKQGPTMSRSMEQLLSTPMKQDRMAWRRSGRGAAWTKVGEGYEPTGTAPLEGGIQGQDMMGGIMPEDFDFTKAGRGAAGQRGLLERNMNPYGTQFGFSQADVEGSMQALIGAGATSEGARDLSGMGLQMQRNLRLGNAQQVMGQLGAAGVQTGETEQSVIKLMSEAVKLGVDTSKMPQEMQRMTAITAELATRGGGFDESAAGVFGAGLTSFTKMGMEGAKGAYEEMLGRAKTAGGYEGQMGMGFLMGEGATEAFGKQAAGKLKGDSKLMNTLNQMSASDLEKDPALAKGLADQMEITPEELIEGMRKKDEFKQTRTGSQMTATKQLGEKIKGMKPEDVAKFIEGEGAGLYAKVVQEDIAAYGTAESGKGREERRAAITGRAKRMVGDIGGGTEGIESDLQRKLGSDEGLTDVEKIKSAQATGDLVKIQAINKNLDELSAAASKHTVAAEMYNEQFTKFVKYAKESGDALAQMSGQIEQVVDMLAEKGYTPTSQPKE